MVYDLAAIGESSWGQKILDSFAAVKATADAVVPLSDLSDSESAASAALAAAAAAGHRGRV